MLIAGVFFCFSLVRTNLAQSNRENFGVTEQGNGVFMATIGVASVLTQSVGLPLLTKFITNTQGQLIAGCLISILAFLGNIFSISFELTIVAVSVMILGNGVLTTTITARYSQALPKGNTGSGLGVSGAVQSLMGVIAPTLAGFLYYVCIFEFFYF